MFQCHHVDCYCYVSGSDLLLHGSRNGGVAGTADQSAGAGASGMVHPALDTGHPVMPGSTVMFNNVNSFYTPQPFNSLFSPTYTVHHPPIRPSSRDTDMGPAAGQLGSGSSSAATNSTIRHPSGGSLTGGSVGSHTPPSPEDRGQYKHGSSSVIIDRNSGVRNSFEQRQCSSVGSDQPSGSPGGAAYRGLQPSSPAAQKSPFDMTTMGMSKSVCNYTSTSTHSNSAFTSTGVVAASGLGRNSSSVISASVRNPSSPYNIKQEPGSPAARVIKPEVGNNASPHSPRTGSLSLSPPPGQSSNLHSQGYSSAGGSLERKLIQSRIHSSVNSNNSNNSGQGFNFPSPQSHNSHPISPAGVVGEATSGINNNNSSNNNHPRPSSKFRYPSGPTPVQNMSPGDSTSNSAMSSREGTPGPAPGTIGRQSWCESDPTGPAPNVDISHVQVKEEFGHSLMRPYDTSTHTLDDYSRRPSVNLSYPAISTGVVSSPIDTYTTGYVGYHHGMPQQVAIPPRSFHPMRPGPVHPGLHGTGSLPGRPLSLPGNGESSSHSNVKIGRRPAHLPKVLKFSDNTLPHGWVRKLKQRKHGKQAGRWDVYIYSPCGVKFASRKKLRHFFEKNNLQYDPEDFDFTPYGRHIEQSAHARHHSSSDTVHRSPSSVSSPTSSYNSAASGPGQVGVGATSATGPGLHPSDYKSDYIGNIGNIAHSFPMTDNLCYNKIFM